MNICSKALVKRLGVDPRSLFQTTARIFGASCSYKIEILGVVLLHVSGPKDNIKPRMASVPTLLYVASNVDITYLSMSLYTGKTPCGQASTGTLDWE